MARRPLKVDLVAEDLTKPNGTFCKLSINGKEMKGLHEIILLSSAKSLTLLINLPGEINESLQSDSPNS